MLSVPELTFAFVILISPYYYLHLKLFSYITLSKITVMWTYLGFHNNLTVSNYHVLTLLLSERNFEHRTSGGYTPLHLAAMQNDVSVVELLNFYGADPNIRDYSGKKPKQWLQRNASAHMNQILQARRTNHGGTTPVEAPTCDSAIGKAMFLGLGAVGLKSSAGKENAPLPRPVSTSKDELMPPPSSLPTVLRAKPVQRQKDVHSDSEMSSPLPQKKLHGSDSSPDVGTIVWWRTLSDNVPCLTLCMISVLSDTALYLCIVCQCALYTSLDYICGLTMCIVRHAQYISALSVH